MGNQGQAITQAWDSSWGQSSAALAKAGQLNPEQSDRFITYVMDQSVLSNIAQVFRMKYSSRRIPLVSMNANVLKPASRGVDPTPTATSSVTEVVLNTKEMIAEGVIYDDELEDSVEGHDFQDTFMRLLAMRVGNQLEQAYITGVSTAGSPTAVDISQLFNGWEYQTKTNGHVLDGTPVNTLWSDRYLSTAKLTKLVKQVPNKYRASKTRLAYLLNPDAYADFADIVGARATVGGDVAYRAGGLQDLSNSGQSVLGWQGIPIYQVPLLPENEFVAKASSPASTTVASGGAAGTNTVTLTSATGFASGDAIKVGSGATAETGIATLSGAVATVAVNSSTGNFLYSHAASQAIVNGTADGTFVMLTHADNLLVGIQRAITIELERRARERATYVVTTLRADCQMLNPDASAILTGLAIR